MMNRVSESADVTGVLDKAAGLDQPGGDERIKRIIRRVSGDLCRTIEEFGVTPTEFWTAVDYLGQVGAHHEMGLLIPGLGLEHFMDALMDEQERKAGLSGATPRTIEGPLWIACAPLVESGEARLDQDPEHGEVLFVDGRVTDTDGTPVAGALVDVWHANTKGGYSHFDPSQSPYNLRRRMRTDVDGRYRFRSVVPAGYGLPPGGPTSQLLEVVGRHGRRPAHIHYFVEAPGHRKLTTQINLADDEYLHDDFAFGTRDGLISAVTRHTDPEEIRARGLNEPFSTITFDFVLYRATEGLPDTVVVRQHAPAGGLTRSDERGTAAMTRDFAIREITATIVDVPTVREHKLSQTSVRAQNYVLVRVRLENGATGIGEAATLGGPRWSEESVEAVKANIDAYLAPVLLGQPASSFVANGTILDAAAKRNNAAKAAIDTALYDAVGRSLALPVSALLGGAVRRSIPVLWTLASGDSGQELEEADGKLEARLHRRFKVKLGAKPPADDMARMRRLATALEGRAELVVDANQAWDETVSLRCLREMAEMGVALVEQPLPAWNVDAMSRLRRQSGTPPLLADEAVFDVHDMMRVGAAGAADAVSLKLVKHASMRGLQDVAAVAVAAGVQLYGGCLLESSVGAGAHLQVFSTLRELHWGCEHFGPQILVADLVTEPLRFADFHVHLPQGPGLGLELDEAAVRRFART